jgi:serine protease AprX
MFRAKANGHHPLVGLGRSAVPALVGALALALASLAASAAPLEEESTASPGVSQLPQDRPAGPPPGLADRDGDGLSDVLQAKLAEGLPGDRFDVIVTFSGPGNTTSAQQAVGPFGVKREFEIISGFAATMTAAQIRALARVPGVFRVSEDGEVRAFLATARSDFGADNAVNLLGYTGFGIGICVVDTGVDPKHEQLNNGKVVDFHDFVNGRTGAYDDHGHGTHVAAIAAGDGVGTRNAATYKGVAPEASIYSAKVLDANGSGSDSDVVAGVEWCAGQAGVDVINLSLGDLSSSDGLDPLSLAVNAAAGAPYDKVPVVAAGNAGPGQYQISSPAAAEQAITVAAVADWSGERGINLAAFSSRGPTADERTKPDISAPGVRVTSAAAGGNGKKYVTFSGTSMATPFVAGTVALVLDADPSLTPQQVKDLLKSTAQYRGDPTLTKNIDWGWGLVDVYAAVAEAEGVTGYEPTAFPTYARIDDIIPDFTEESYLFDVTDPDTPIAVTMTNGGTWTCTWQVVLIWLVCGETSTGSDLDAELYDPDGILVDVSTCVGDSDTDCGLQGRQETLLASAPVKVGTWTVRVYPWNGDAFDLEDYSTVGIDLSFGPAAAAESGPPLDSRPTASIANPADGSTVSGSQTIKVNATDAEDAAGSLDVEVSVDGGAWQAVGYNGSTGYYELGWATAGLTDGSHSIDARVTDSASNMAAASATVTTENTDDAPVASWVGPGAGDTVNGTVAIRIAAQDDRDSVGTLTVEWRVDGGTWLAATYNSTSGYYEASWDTTGVGDGDHSLHAQATDGAGAGNLSLLATITVTVSNTGPTAVEVDSVTYATEGGRDKDKHLLITVALVNNSGSPVSGASVSIRLDQVLVASWTGTGATGTDGTVTFSLKNAPSGCYTTTVTDVAADGLTWDGATPTNGLFCKSGRAVSSVGPEPGAHASLAVVR